jgi:hypothetical protein
MPNRIGVRDMGHAKRIDVKDDRLGSIVREAHDQQEKWLKEYYSTLHLARINKVEIYEEDDAYGVFWPRLHVTLRDGEKIVIEVSQDEEGNGPGFIFGLFAPKE